MENNYIGYADHPLPKIPKAINKMAADVLIGQLEKGKLPWQKPWTGYESKKSASLTDSGFHRYRGLNMLLLWAAAINNGYASKEWDTVNAGHKKIRKSVRARRERRLSSSTPMMNTFQILK